MGSCVDVPIVFAPNANTNRLISDTRVKFCTVGVSEAPLSVDIFTAREDGPVPASQ